ncbi:MAG TPA: serine hydrolase domain-containing protein [Allosphingosinicella sp.]|jgi:CubicO group peptidase (beta-lactamase class C family)
MRLIVFALGLVAAACATAETPLPVDAALEAAADEGMAKTNTPALAILEIRDGRPMREIVRGVREIGTREPVKPGDSWHIGSNAKPITATLIAMLVEQGKLRWDSRLEELLPGFASTMRPELRDVTVLDLATHQSGLSPLMGEALLEPYYGNPRPLPEQRTSILKEVLTREPTQPRGTYAYSNRGYILLGAIADRVGGKPVEQLFRDMIFRPLGMTTATFGPTSRGQPLGHEGGKAVLGPRQDNPPYATTAGTMRMSLGDWARWAIDQMKGERGGGKLLKPASYRFLHTAQLSPPGRKTALTPGWGVRSESYGRILTHTGSNGLWFAVIALAPDLQNGILTATNSAEDMKGELAGDPAFYLVTGRWKQQGQGAAAGGR